MGSFSLASELVFDAKFQNLFDGCPQNLNFPVGYSQNPIFSNGYSQNPIFTNGYSQNPIFSNGSSTSSSLVLDSERGELVKAPVRLGKKGVSEEKAVAAMKNHSEAERRRRERINSHLNTLRNIVPCTEKMDKASLLAEVVSHVKELKRRATEACNGFVIPMDVDEVRVEPKLHEDGAKGVSSIKVSFCCEDRPEILSDLRQALKPFNLKIVNAEITSLEGRMKNVFVMEGCKEENIDDAEVRLLLASSVHQAVKSVLDKYSSPQEYSPRTNKRQRFSLFDSSSSSS